MAKVILFFILHRMGNKQIGKSRQRNRRLMSTSPGLGVRHFRTRSGASIGFSTIGFGTAPLGNLYRPLSEKQAAATLDAAKLVKIRTGTASPRSRKACNTLSPSRPGNCKSSKTASNPCPACKQRSACTPSVAKLTAMPPWRKAVPSHSEMSGVSSTKRTWGFRVFTEQN